jgi:hypothetical protein
MRIAVHVVAVGLGLFLLFCAFCLYEDRERQIQKGLPSTRRARANQRSRVRGLADEPIWTRLDQLACNRRLDPPVNGIDSGEVGNSADPGEGIFRQPAAGDSTAQSLLWSALRDQHHSPEIVAMSLE